MPNLLQNNSPDLGPIRVIPIPEEAANAARKLAGEELSPTEQIQLARNLAAGTPSGTYGINGEPLSTLDTVTADSKAAVLERGGQAIRLASISEVPTDERLTAKAQRTSDSTAWGPASNRASFRQN